MKAHNTIPLLLLLLCLPFTASYAQSGGLDKGKVLAAMNNVDGLNLSADKERELKEANENAVNKLFDIAQSDMSEEEKEKKFLSAKKDNVNRFKGILGDNEFEKYQKKVKKQLRPFKRKAKLVGFIL